MTEGRTIMETMVKDINIKAKTEALEKAFYALSEKLYAQAQQAQGDPNAQGGDGQFYDANYEDNSNN